MSALKAEGPVLKAWPPLGELELHLEFRGRPAPGLGLGRPVARGQLLALSRDPLDGDVMAPAPGVIVSAGPSRILMRAGPARGGRPPSPVKLAGLSGPALGEALRRLGVPRPAPPPPGEPAVIALMDPEPGLSAAAALRRDLESVLLAGAEVLARLWPGVALVEVPAPGAKALGVGRLVKTAISFPMTLPSLIRLAVLGRHDPTGSGVVSPEILWAMGAAARTELPPAAIPLTIQRFAYLAPPGLRLIDALASLNLRPLQGDGVVLGGLVTGRATARLDRGLDRSMGAVHLVRARPAPPPPGPCRRCRACREACPLGLPIDLIALRDERLWPELAPRHQGIFSECLACGACALACPADRPLLALALMAGGGAAARKRP